MALPPRTLIITTLFLDDMEEYIQNRVNEIAKYILQALLYNTPIFMSWGVDPKSIKPVMVENMPGLQFHTQAYLHTGYVQVVIDEGADTFVVRLLSDEDDTLLSTTEDVYLSDLTSVIDVLVERCDNYEDKVSQDYPILSELAKQENPPTIIIA